MSALKISSTTPSGVPSPLAMAVNGGVSALPNVTPTRIGAPDLLRDKSTSNSGPPPPPTSVLSPQSSPSMLPFSPSHGNTQSTPWAQLRSFAFGDFKSESIATRKTRMAEEALKTLHSMAPQLGFSFDAVGENENPFMGLLVDAVETGSPASAGGLRPRDVVIEVNGHRTLTLSDLLNAIRGVVPGNELEFVIEREERENILAIRLGAKGFSMDEVDHFHALIKAATDDASDVRNALSLSDLLEVPQYRRVFLRYLESNLCAESLHFLLAATAFERLALDEDAKRRSSQSSTSVTASISSPNSASSSSASSSSSPSPAGSLASGAIHLPFSDERRRHFARLIAQEFIYEDSESMVNLDADTRKSIVTKLATSEYSSLLFHDAARVVYKMLENDVFRRFVNSTDYKEMMDDQKLAQEGLAQASQNSGNSPPAAAANAAAQLPTVTVSRKHRDYSFCVLPIEERVAELESLQIQFENSGHVHDRRVHLKKVRACFRGAELVDWLLEKGVAMHRPAAAAIGIRLYECFMLRHIFEEFEFEDNDKLFTFLPANAYADGPSVSAVHEKARTNTSALYEGSLLVRGIHYNRFYVILVKDKKKLWIFRNANADNALVKLKLKGAQYRIFADERKKEAKRSSPSVSRRSRRTSKDDVFRFSGTPAERHAAAMAKLKVASDDNFFSKTSPPSSVNSANQAPAARVHATPSLFDRVKRESVFYLQLDAFHALTEKPRTVVFRFDGKAELDTWVAELIKSGVVAQSALSRSDSERDRRMAAERNAATHGHIERRDDKKDDSKKDQKTK